MKKLLVALLSLAIGVLPLGIVPVAAQDTTEPDRAVDRELILVRVANTGEIVRTTLLNSLTIFGEGRVQITDLGETVGVRNLYGFETPILTGRNLTWTTNVRGSEEIVTSAPVTKELPISIRPRYFLDGNEVTPGELAGKSGNVSIEYTVANTTRKFQDLTFTEASGHEVTRPAETYVPFVGSVEMLLPAESWKRITAEGGQVTTDERKVSHVTFTTILAPIIGSVTQRIRVDGVVENFKMGETRMSFAPLVPGSALGRAQGTSDATARLFGGVNQIDENLLKIYQGTLQLVDGLTQLYEGILKARAGVGAVGTDNTIVDGLDKVLNGLKLLGDANAGLPAAKAGIDALIAGVEQIIAGLGSANTPGTILGGLAGIEAGLAGLRGVPGPPPTGLHLVKGGIDATNAGVGAIATAVGTDPDPAAPVAPTPLTTISNDVQFLKDRAIDAATVCDAYAALLGVPSCTALGIGPATMTAVGGAAQTKLDVARTCMTTGGVPGVCAGPEPNGISEALTALSAGTQTAIDGIGLPTDAPTASLRGGVAAVTAGVNLVKAGLSSGNPNDPKVLEGLQAVGAGLAKAIAGVGTVGTSNTLTDGVDKLFTGSKTLGDGLDQIADGTFKARGGAETIGQSQYLLSTFGLGVMRGSVGDSREEASKAVAILKAMQERAATDGFLYGPPEGADGSTTYVFAVAGVSKADLSLPIKFAVAGIIVFGLIVVGGAALRRSS